MFKRIAMIAVALILPLALAAQEPPPIAIVAHVLSLSDEQVHALVDFLQARGEAIRPAAEQLQTRQQALGHELQSSSPDPATVGRLVLEIRTIEGQIQQALAEANTKLDDILSADQRTH